MQKNDRKQYWQYTAGLYAPFMKSSTRLYRKIYERMLPDLNREMNVLELACGTGQLSFPLSLRVRLWEATDFSEAMIAQAKKRTKKQGGSSRLHFSVQDATVLPYAPQTFDAVVISNALHIMPHPELALSEMKRVLKPGGLLFAPTFVKKGRDSLRMRLLKLTGFHTFHNWNEVEYINFLNSHGFSVVKQETLSGGPAPLCFAVALQSQD